MDHQGTKILESARLLLRPMTLEDRDAMYRNWASDPEVTKYLTWQHYASPDVADAVLRDWAAQYDRADYYQWGIVLKSLGEPIGTISAVRQDQRVGSAEIGYCIGRPWWHQGVTSEALGLVIDYLIGQVGFNRVEARHDVNNPNSGAVMRKCGMTYEGTHRQAGRNNQGICDMATYAILARDWRQAHGKGGICGDMHDRTK